MSTTAQQFEPSPYIGRFAPSPTGPLHFGSVVAALASFLQARTANGRWLLRIEDIDPPREQPDAAQQIVETLAALELVWDGEVDYQSAHSARYDAALEKLARQQQTFPCGCTRREIGGLRYPGTCRDGLPPGRQPRSVRVRVTDRVIQFDDRLQGWYRQNLDETVGDFILRRADGLYAYHLAVVVDDADANVTEIVRGIDLIDSTSRQIYLQQLLKIPTASYVHIPVVLNVEGHKLSKQTFATPVLTHNHHGALFHALRFLNQDPPPTLATAPHGEVIDWALQHWRLDRVGTASRYFETPW